MEDNTIYHLRRIGPRSTLSNAVNLIDFHKIVTLIGRSNNGDVDYVIDSSKRERRLYISRLHARLVREEQYNTHTLFDDSQNGIFVNNIKIGDSVVLQEGNIVTFGHPNGQNIQTGEKRRQPDSEYQFIFERCMCANQNSHLQHQNKLRTLTSPITNVRADSSITRKYDTDIISMVDRRNVDCFPNSNIHRNEIPTVTKMATIFEKRRNDTLPLLSSNLCNNEKIPQLSKSRGTQTTKLCTVTTCNGAIPTADNTENVYDHDKDSVINLNISYTNKNSMTEDVEMISTEVDNRGKTASFNSNITVPNMTSKTHNEETTSITGMEKTCSFNNYMPSEISLTTEIRTPSLGEKSLISTSIKKPLNEVVVDKCDHEVHRTPRRKSTTVLGEVNEHHSNSCHDLSQVGNRSAAENNNSDEVDNDNITEDDTVQNMSEVRGYNTLKEPLLFHDNLGIEQPAELAGVISDTDSNSTGFSIIADINLKNKESKINQDLDCENQELDCENQELDSTSQDLIDKIQDIIDDLEYLEKKDHNISHEEKLLEDDDDQESENHYKRNGSCKALNCKMDYYYQNAVNEDPEFDGDDQELIRADQGGHENEISEQESGEEIQKSNSDNQESIDQRITSNDNLHNAAYDKEMNKDNNDHGRCKDDYEEEIDEKKSYVDVENREWVNVVHVNTASKTLHQDLDIKTSQVDDPEFDGDDPDLNDNDLTFDDNSSGFDGENPKLNENDFKFDGADPEFDNINFKFGSNSSDFDGKDPKLYGGNPEFDGGESEFDDNHFKFDSNDSEFNYRDPDFVKLDSDTNKISNTNLDKKDLKLADNEISQHVINTYDTNVPNEHDDDSSRNVDKENLHGEIVDSEFDKTNRIQNISIAMSSHVFTTETESKCLAEPSEYIITTETECGSLSLSPLEFTTETECGSLSLSTSEFKTETKSESFAEPSVVTTETECGSISLSTSEFTTATECGSISLSTSEFTTETECGSISLSTSDFKTETESESFAEPSVITTENECGSISLSTSEFTTETENGSIAESASQFTTEAECGSISLSTSEFTTETENESLGTFSVATNEIAHGTIGPSSQELRNETEGESLAESSEVKTVTATESESLAESSVVTTRTQCDYLSQSIQEFKITIENEILAEPSVVMTETERMTIDQCLPCVRTETERIFQSSEKLAVKNESSSKSVEQTNLLERSEHGTGGDETAVKLEERTSILDIKDGLTEIEFAETETRNKLKEYQIDRQDTVAKIIPPELKTTKNCEPSEIKLVEYNEIPTKLTTAKNCEPSEIKLVEYNEIPTKLKTTKNCEPSEVKLVENTTIPTELKTTKRCEPSEVKLVENTTIPTELKSTKRCEPSEVKLVENTTIPTELKYTKRCEPSEVKLVENTTIPTELKTTKNCEPSEVKLVENNGIPRELKTTKNCEPSEIKPVENNRIEPFDLHCTSVKELSERCIDTAVEIEKRESFELTNYKDNYSKDLDENIGYSRKRKLPSEFDNSFQNIGKKIHIDTGFVKLVEKMVRNFFERFTISNSTNTPKDIRCDISDHSEFLSILESVSMWTKKSLKYLVMNGLKALEINESLAGDNIINKSSTASTENCNSLESTRINKLSQTHPAHAHSDFEMQQENLENEMRFRSDSQSEYELVIIGPHHLVNGFNDQNVYGTANNSMFENEVSVYGNNEEKSKKLVKEEILCENSKTTKSIMSSEVNLTMEVNMDNVSRDQGLTQYTGESQNVHNDLDLTQCIGKSQDVHHDLDLTQCIGKSQDVHHDLDLTQCTGESLDVQHDLDLTQCTGKSQDVHHDLDLTQCTRESQDVQHDLDLTQCTGESHYVHHDLDLTQCTRESQDVQHDLDLTQCTGESQYVHHDLDLTQCIGESQDVHNDLDLTQCTRESQDVHNDLDLKQCTGEAQDVHHDLHLAQCTGESQYFHPDIDDKQELELPQEHITDITVENKAQFSSQHYMRIFPDGNCGGFSKYLTSKICDSKHDDDEQIQHKKLVPVNNMLRGYIFSGASAGDAISIKGTSAGGDNDMVGTSSDDERLIMDLDRENSDINNTMRANKVYTNLKTNETPSSMIRSETEKSIKIFFDEGIKDSDSNGIQMLPLNVDEITLKSNLVRSDAESMVEEFPHIQDDCYDSDHGESLDKIGTSGDGYDRIHNVDNTGTATTNIYYKGKEYMNLNVTIDSEENLDDIDGKEKLDVIDANETHDVINANQYLDVSDGDEDVYVFSAVEHMDDSTNSDMTLPPTQNYSYSRNVVPSPDLYFDDSDSLPEVEFLKASPVKHPIIIKDEIFKVDSGLESDQNTESIPFNKALIATSTLVVDKNNTSSTSDVFHCTPRDDDASSEKKCGRISDCTPTKGKVKAETSTPSQHKLKLTKYEWIQVFKKKKKESNIADTSTLSKRKRDLAKCEKKKKKKETSARKKICQKELGENDNNPRKSKCKRKDFSPRIKTSQREIGTNENMPCKTRSRKRRFDNSPKIKDTPAKKGKKSKKKRQVGKRHSRIISDDIEIITDNESDIEPTNDKRTMVKSDKLIKSLERENEPYVVALTNERSVTHKSVNQKEDFSFGSKPYVWQENDNENQNEEQLNGSASDIDNISSEDSMSLLSSQQNTMTVDYQREPSPEEGPELSICYSNTMVANSVTDDDSICLDNLPALKPPKIKKTNSWQTRKTNSQKNEKNNLKLLTEGDFDDENGGDIEKIVDSLENETVCYGDIVEDQKLGSEYYCMTEDLPDDNFEVETISPINDNIPYLPSDTAPFCSTFNEDDSECLAHRLETSTFNDFLRELNIKIEKDNETWENSNICSTVTPGIADDTSTAHDLQRELNIKNEKDTGTLWENSNIFSTVTSGTAGDTSTANVLQRELTIQTEKDTETLWENSNIFSTVTSITPVDTSTSNVLQRELNIKTEKDTATLWENSNIFSTVTSGTAGDTSTCNVLQRELNIKTEKDTETLWENSNIFSTVTSGTAGDTSTANVLQKKLNIKTEKDTETLWENSNIFSTVTSGDTSTSNVLPRELNIKTEKDTETLRENAHICSTVTSGTQESCNGNMQKFFRMDKSGINRLLEKCKANIKKLKFPRVEVVQNEAGPSNNTGPDN